MGIEYALPTPSVAAAERIRSTPNFGFDYELSVSTEPSFEVGELIITGANTLSWEPYPSAVAALDTTPADLALVLVDQGITSTANVVFTLTGQNQVPAADEWVATYANLSWAGNTDKVWRLGFAAALAASPVESPSKKVKTLGSPPFAVSCAADVTGAKFRVLRLPSIGSFRTLGCTTAYEVTDPVQQQVAVACGANAAAFTRPGMTQEGRVTVRAKQGALASGLSKYSGVEVTLMAAVRVGGGSIVAERHVHRGVRFSQQQSAGEGADQATSTFETAIRAPIYFMAP